MKNKEALDTLHDIKELMEKSTKFLSISGLSSILVGIYACIATGLAYSVLTTHEQINASQRLTLLCLIAIAVLLTSLVTVFCMSYCKAKKANRTNRFIACFGISFSRYSPGAFSASP